MIELPEPRYTRDNAGAAEPFQEIHSKTVRAPGRAWSPLYGSQLLMRLDYRSYSMVIMNLRESGVEYPVKVPCSLVKVK